MVRFTEKVALVTGAGSGIGLATAELLAREGARVILFGRDGGALEAACRAIGPTARAVTGDMCRLEDIDALYASIRDREGGLDVLFANAGVARMLPVTDVGPEAYAETFDTNVRGTFFMMQKAIPLLRPGASVVVNTSVANRSAVPAMSLYAASKAACRSFVQCFAAELLPRNVRVNAVAPGPTATPIHGKYGIPPEMLEGLGRATLDLVPLRRMAQPSEIASVVAFLASSESSFMVGEEVAVDGGITNL